MSRRVKLGRKLIAPYIPGLALHWAVQVASVWYELLGTKAPGQKNRIDKSHGHTAQSGAGSLGGEIVGLTTKSDCEIDRWTAGWLRKNPEYDVLNDNCQKFAYEFIAWLTGGVFTIPHRLTAALSSDEGRVGGFATSDGGNAIARWGGGEHRAATGPLSIGMRSVDFQAQAVAGPGLGAFADASLGRVEASAGPVGVHLDANINTGAGARNGNIEAHILGFGGRAGADGVEINTPLGGANCALM